MSRRLVAILGAALFLASAAGHSVVVAQEVGTISHFAGGKPVLDPPILSVVATTTFSITLQVCAGNSGAPAGFSVQWQTAADYAANGWTNYCDASFGGFPSRYELAPGQCVDIVLGDLLADPGESSSCTNALACGTEYVIRAFAHGSQDFVRSDFTSTLPAATAECAAPGCTRTQGYWRNHATSPGWPVTTLLLGTVSYSQDQLLAIFGAPVKGNGLISLAQQLTAAKLNIASGASSSSIASTIADADALIGGLVVPSVGTGYLAPAVTANLTTALDAYNSGITGPGHCPD